MGSYEFTAVLDRSVDTDADHDRIYEAGLDDSTPEGDRLHVHRRADTLIAAILSVAADAAEAGFRVIGVDNEDLVTLDDIATRTGRTHESVRLLSRGKRGPGDWPDAVYQGPISLYSWNAVAHWLRDRYHQPVPVDDDAELLVAADHILRAAHQVARTDHRSALVSLLSPDDAIPARTRPDVAAPTRPARKAPRSASP